MNKRADMECHPQIGRRGFLKGIIAAGVFPHLALARNGREFASGDKVRLACVGVGQRAWSDILEFEKTNLVEIVALCDTDLEGKQCEKALAKYPAAPRFTDFRKMLDAMEGKIDAVAVMGPDFSHFPALMDTMRRGLAVFSEKPLAHTFEECELLLAAAAKYGVVTQMGNQGHSGDNYWQFKEYVEKGIIDVSKLKRLVAHMNMPRRWHKWNGKVAAFPSGEKMPNGLDWDTWLGTAAFHEYSKDYVQGEWRSWYDFGNGCLGDWGAHTMDTMHRFFDLGLPSEVRIRVSPQGMEQGHPGCERLDCGGCEESSVARQVLRDGGRDVLAGVFALRADIHVQHRRESTALHAGEGKERPLHELLPRGDGARRDAVAVFSRRAALRGVLPRMHSAEAEPQHQVRPCREAHSR